MEPAVPFALLGSVVLLSTAAWAGLAGTAVVRSRRRDTRLPALLLVGGALVLAVTDVVLATRFGRAGSDLLPLARAAGLLLVGAGLYAGALSRRVPAPPAVPAGVAGVVVPLGAAPAPALLVALAAAGAAAGSLRARRDVVGALLAAGLAATGLAAVVSTGAEDSPGAAVAVLVLHGLGAALLLSALAGLARASLLAKVVGSILAGVLVMAAAAVGVVGTVVERGYDREQASLVEDAADGRLALLRRTLDESVPPVARVAADACRQRPDACGDVLQQLAPGARDFAVDVPTGGAAQVLGGGAPLTSPEAVGLAGSPLVRTAAGGAGLGGAVDSSGLASVVRLVGSSPGLALAVAVPRDRPAAGEPAGSVFVYGQRLDDDFAGRDFDAGGFGLTLLLGDEVVASNLSLRVRERLVGIAREAGVGSALPAEGLTVAASGQSPTVHFRPVTASTGEPVATLALSRDATSALESQRRALTALLLTALATTVVVGGLALLAGRRTVEPVQRLTAAVRRVSAGDLSVRTEVGGRDEVAVLSRTFDTMTGNLAGLTEDLRASAARLETVLASMSDGLVAADGAGRVTSINRAALALTGLDTPDDAVGRPLADVVVVRDAAGASLADVALRLQDEPGEVEQPDGTAVPVRVAVTPLQSGDGVVLVLRDTTREREVERMKTEFLSNVSHELRTPLTPIRGYADILVSRPGLPPDKVTTFATTILAESIKMNRVVDLLVDVAAIEAGRVTITPKAISARDLLDARLEHWRSRAPERAGDLRRRVSAGLPDVWVDPTWVGKALDELVDNAVKYTPAGTSITLAATRAPDGERVRVAVRDTGPGIDPARHETLFTSFEQVDGSATRRVGGLGLGLSFVRRLAEDAGFPLSVASQPGKGAEFALDLPAAEQPPAPEPRRPARRPARRARS